jgi:hypothetical protein
MKKLALVGGLVVIMVAGAWCVYALMIPNATLAQESRCHSSVFVRALNATRVLFHAKTGAEIDAASYQGDPLQQPAALACAQ